ncbi:MAG: glycerate kinase [Chlamydiales bacterium]|nr:glycerate kinase [Chlamydiales bacterium]
MRVLISPQAYKGVLTGFEVSQAIREGVLKACSHATVILQPVADGGDGTLDTLMSGQGEYLKCEASDALGRPCEATYGVCSDGKTVVIELAKICGLAKVHPEDRNAMSATTYGVGQVILDALERGYRSFVLAVGGSASTDGGTGIARALGARLIGSFSAELPNGGGSLGQLTRIDLRDLDVRVCQSRLVVACDVSNPLIGLNGAAQMYALQKGASEAEVATLEAALMHFGELVKGEFSKNIADMPFAGAAGGSGGGLHALLGAELRSGAELVLERIGFRDLLGRVDLVITGEGCLDAQTAFGKAPHIVALQAKALNVPCLAIVGSVGHGYEVNSFSAVFPATWLPREHLPNKHEAITAIAKATEQAVRCWVASKSFGV